MRFKFSATSISLVLSTIVILSLFTYQVNTDKIKSIFFKKDYAQKNIEKLEYFKKIKKTDLQIKHDKYTTIGVELLQVAPFVISIATRNPIMYLTYASSVAISTPIVFFGKKIFKEPRPDDKNDRTSFPSGHSAFAFLSAITLIICIKNKKYKYSFGLLFIIIASYVALGRIMANRHWPIDVIFGSLFGIISAIIAYIFIKNLNKKLLHFKC